MRRSRSKSAHKCIPYNNRCVQNFIQIIGWDLAVRGPKTCFWVKDIHRYLIDLWRFQWPWETLKGGTRGTQFFRRMYVRTEHCLPSCSPRYMSDLLHRVSDIIKMPSPVVNLLWTGHPSVAACNRRWSVICCCRPPAIEHSAWGHYVCAVFTGVPTL